MFKTIECSTCGKALLPTTIKYHTADQQHAFCDAYCSHDWYTKNVFNKDKPDAKAGDTITF
tara:strand:+ start:700 stop:882 length:183 start_codon:yes stop_codon:yes gene_type:complete